MGKVASYQEYRSFQLIYLEGGAVQETWRQDTRHETYLDKLSLDQSDSCDKSDR
jgi:hypothetical protein